MFKLLFVIFSILLFTVKAFRDFYGEQEKNSEHPIQRLKFNQYWHSIDCLRDLFTILFIFFFTIKLSFHQMLGVFALFILLRWLIVDLVLNLLKRKSINYIGLSITDTFLSWIKDNTNIQPFTFKIMLLIPTLFYYIFIL